MLIWQAIIFGTIEGLTEFLPISSTAHLIIGSKLMGVDLGSESIKSFLIIIQLGAILSVLSLYAKKIIKEPKVILKLIIAFIPTALIGLLAYKLIKNYLLESLLVISISLALGGLVILLLENYFKKNTNTQVPIATEDLKDISYRQAFLIGLAQSLAIIPGVSRSAATIMGGLAIKISRKAIVEFSFLLALPTMLAASILDVYKSPLNLNKGEIYTWLIALIIAFFVAIFSIKYLLNYIQRKDFKVFAWYRIVLAIIILVSLTIF